MTSNLGVKKIQEFGLGMGFAKSDNTFVKEEMKKDILNKELKKFFAPEFLNRIDETIVFNTLSEDDVKKIVRIEIQKLQTRLTDIKYNFNFDESVIEMIAKAGFDEDYGARPLKRAIQEKVEDFISEEILKNNIHTQTDYILKCKDEDIFVELFGETKPKKTRKKKEIE
jgi:ATP-dependent Clp protease ATP-binding subunit ClpC